MSTLQNNIASLEALIEKANALPEEKTIQSSKTVTPTTSSQTVKPDSGYDGMGQVVVNAMPTGSVGAPSISIDANGKITATAAVNAGYVDGTDKTGTKTMTTQAAKTITPTKSAQTAVASGMYTTGAVTVAAIPDQYITTTDATAAAEDIVTGETAYVNGSKVTGSNPYVKSTTDTTVNTQADLIAEISELLEGKAVNSGSSGVETCTVTIKASNNGRHTGYACSVLDENGRINVASSRYTATKNIVTISNVICNTPITVTYDGSLTSVLDNATVIAEAYGFYGIYHITAANGETVTINNASTATSGN